MIEIIITGDYSKGVRNFSDTYMFEIKRDGLLWSLEDYMIQFGHVKSYNNFESGIKFIKEQGLQAINESCKYFMVNSTMKGDKPEPLSLIKDGYREYVLDVTYCFDIALDKLKYDYGNVLFAKHLGDNSYYKELPKRRPEGRSPDDAEGPASPPVDIQFNYVVYTSDQNDTKNDKLIQDAEIARQQLQARNEKLKQEWQACIHNYLIKAFKALREEYSSTTSIHNKQNYFLGIKYDKFQEKLKDSLRSFEFICKNWGLYNANTVFKDDLDNLNEMRKNIMTLKEQLQKELLRQDLEQMRARHSQDNIQNQNVYTQNVYR